jgi:hypothetical protein
MTPKDFLKQLIKPKNHPRIGSSIYRKKVLKSNLVGDVSGENQGTVNQSGLIDLKSLLPVKIKKQPLTEDEKLMEKINPKRFVSEFASGGEVTTAPLKKVLSRFTKTKTPIKYTDDKIHIAPVHNMFHWFPDLVNKIERSGTDVTGHLPSEPNSVVKKLNIGNETAVSHIHKNGTIRVDVHTPYGSYPDKKTNHSTYSMEYTPPQTHSDSQTDIIMHIPASFKFMERRADPVLGTKYSEIHPNVAISDTAPLESKLTGRHVSAVRYERGIKAGQHRDPKVMDDIVNKAINSKV